ncbi:MAG: cytochrome b/b6 domain-containing protein [Elusimicrobia bacterium]|nr:cytochrome b/b6 domain-containing protein [Elusimicrobiota bacterium]
MPPPRRRSLWTLPWVGAAVAGAVICTPALRADDNETCLACHGSSDMGAPVVDMAAYAKSIHGGNLCVSCHTDAAEIPHPEKLAPVSCAKCHRLETQIYLQSDHGRAVARGKAEAASCKDCHGHSHTLLNSRNPASPVNRKNIHDTCAACHGKADAPANQRLTERRPVDSYDHTVHGLAFAAGKINAAVCSDCHGTHDLHGSANPASRVNRTHIAATCGGCHQNVLAVYKESIHGSASAHGIKESPVCTDCHGEHTIRSATDPASMVFRGAVTKTCSGCHESERLAAKFGLPAGRLKSFMDTYHGLASKRGDMRVANCASCHGWHDVLPHTDTRSAIHPNNLSNTCGRCHEGAQTKLMSGRIHASAKDRPNLWILFFRWFYLIIIPLTIGGMLIHNLLDYVRKALDGPPPLHGRELTALRLNRSERWQHGVLALTFTVLAYSGFALEFPEAWWARSFQWFGGEPARKALHRWTALVFTLTGVWHAVYMLGTRRGRFLLRVNMLPRLRDLIEPIHLVLFNLGLRKARPSLRYPSYIERAEYWALLWGSLVMVATGALLVFNDWTLKHLPLWVPELATMVHYFEAILACLSILVWHAYWTVFDPSIYPLNWAWLTGRLRRSKNRTENPHGKK